MNATEDKGPISGDCLVNCEPEKWDVWPSHRGDYQLIYRDRKNSSLNGEVDVVAANERTQPAADQNLRQSWHSQLPAVPTQFGLLSLVK